MSVCWSQKKEEELQGCKAQQRSLEAVTASTKTFELLWVREIWVLIFFDLNDSTFFFK